MSAPLNCKLIVLGDSGVGKTAIIHKYVNHEFREDFKATIGADFSTHTCFVNNRQIELQIWDTAGQERFHSVGAAFYRGTDACILVYDITKELSFKQLDIWRKDLIEKAEIDESNFPFIIFGNKCDLEADRQVSFSDAQAYATANRCVLFEVSAKTGQNIEPGFQKIAEMFRDYDKKSVVVIGLTQTQNEEKKCC
ncbi:Ras-related protein Rab-7a [Tritrichomonas foetus]|uniref:Ras-related protein Rab-7b n=1 Tax=Tritrichomonas foetus TaxID=1144522 RepID=A0A1J4KF91_9EUKA|nr:Ras-related protein Rab-7a [Tritrichomonas foetus]|eukprot:OHT08045.1 Ras-related protein Rab-7a [Tritrichomonas foetus]